MTRKSISCWLPEWVLSSTRHKECKKCDSKLSKNNVIAVGIRQNDSSVALYVEYECKKCQYRAMTILGKQKEDTLEKLCYAILEGIKQRKITENSAKLRKKKEGAMTDREIKTMINFIKKAKTHEDLMNKMGIPPQPKQDDKS